jgi:hypothetical protein
MTNSQLHTPPSPKQLRALRNLANATGQSFTYPQTAGQASKEITRLTKASPSRRSDRSRELKAVRHEMASGRGDGARVREEELGGYGSTATWTDPWADERRAEKEDDRGRRNQDAY